MEKKKIMIVDDEESFGTLVKFNLELTGNYEVMSLTSAKDILNQVHAFKPSLILLDLVMPEIGGLEVCEMLNNDPIGINIPIVILSALTSDIDKRKAYKLGVVGYIAKPVETSELIKTIEKSLQSKY